MAVGAEGLLRRERGTLVGNAVLLVVLAGGSHARNPEAGHIDHKPVHLAIQLSVRMNMEPYIQEIIDAQQEWDDVTYGGSNIFFYYYDSEGDPIDEPIDAVILDANPGEFVTISWKAHNGIRADFEYTTRGPPSPHCLDPPEDCYWGETVAISAAQSGVNQRMYIAQLHTDRVVGLLPDPEDRWRLATHELGHVLGLADHNAASVDPLADPCVSLPFQYHGMMNNGCEDSEFDYQIWNLPGLFSPADEASCVRKIFNIPGKELCETCPTQVCFIPAGHPADKRDQRR